MATTTDVPAGVQMIALQEIHTDRNVRQQIVAEEVDALAQSIKLLGQLTPVSVRPAENGGYVLYLQQAIIRSPWMWSPFSLLIWTCGGWVLRIIRPANGASFRPSADPDGCSKSTT